MRKMIDRNYTISEGSGTYSVKAASCMSGGPNIILSRERCIIRNEKRNGMRCQQRYRKPFRGRLWENKDLDSVIILWGNKRRAAKFLKGSRLLMTEPYRRDTLRNKATKTQMTIRWENEHNELIVPEVDEWGIRGNQMYTLNLLKANKIKPKDDLQGWKEE